MQRRHLTILLLLATAIVASALLLYPRLFPGVEPGAVNTMPDATEQAAAALVDAATQPRQFEITAVDGIVEIHRDGQWGRAKPGDVVQRSHRIRTGPDSNATLRSQAGDELELRARVELGVDSLDATVTELSLKRGKISAEAAPGTERLEIRAQGTQATATAGTKFTIYSDDRGAVTVATARGLARVLAAGRQVEVGPRMSTYVAPGAAPRTPIAIPDKVFLTVAWPANEIVRRHTILRGKTRPGNSVTVNGQQVPVDDGGKFVSTVNMVEGKNSLAVSVESIDGRTKTSNKQVLVDTKGPPVNVDPSHLFEPKKKKD